MGNKQSSCSRSIVHIMKILIPAVINRASVATVKKVNVSTRYFTWKKPG